MYKRVKDILTTNDTIWEGIPAFVSAFETMSPKIRLMEEKEAMQQAITVGVSAEKDHIKKERIDRIFRISSALVAFSTSTENEKLRKEMKITHNSLNALARIDLISRIDRIIERAQTHSADLVDFGITLQDVEDIVNHRDELDEQLSNPRKAIDDRKKMNAAIIKLSKEIDMLLSGSIDQLVNVLKAVHPEFFTAYFDARLVIDYHHKGGTNTIQ
ncbi:MAG: hypothetical protein RI883_2272 [Bacteroidota bacterium]